MSKMRILRKLINSGAFVLFELGITALLSYILHSFFRLRLLMTLAVFFSICLGDSSLKAQAVEKDAVPDTARIAQTKMTKSPKGAMLRSLALPGWGQFYNRQWIKGGIVIAAHGALIGAAVYYNNKMSETTVGSNARDYYLDQRNLMFWLLGLTKLLSMVDAYIDAHLYDFDAGPDLALRGGALTPNNANVTDAPLVGLSLRMNF